MAKSDSQPKQNPKQNPSPKPSQPVREINKGTQIPLNEGTGPRQPKK